MIKEKIKEFLLIILFCVIKIIIFLIDIIYNITQIFRKRKNHKICMLSRQSNDITLNFSLLKEEIEKQDKEAEIYISCMRFKFSFKYIINIIKDLWNLSNSKIAIIDGYSIPICNFTNKKLKVFQIWHSFGSMKSFGKNTVGKKNGRSLFVEKAFNMHKNYDYIFASSKAYSKNLVSGFGYGEENCIICPLPVVDVLNRKKKLYNYIRKNEEFEKINKKLDKKKKTILYAPTTRNDFETLESAIFDILDIIDFKKYNFVLKMHKNENINFSQKDIDKYLKNKYNNLNGINAYIDNNSLTLEYILISEILISDYSCVIYEAMEADTNVFLYIPDYNEYIKNTGLEVDLKKEFKDLYAEDKKTLKNILEKKYPKEKMEKIKNKYVTKNENSTETMVKIILEKGR